MTAEQTQRAAAGAAPEGAQDESTAARAVEQMFDEIAPRYDLLNHVLSGNVDKLWWRRTARRFREILVREDAQVLDLCCGTGDMTMALRRHAPANATPYYGVDFSRNMILLGQKKFQDHGIIAIEADALHLPFPDGRFDLLTSAFGFRNLANYHDGLAEIHRVLKSGGSFGILDFSEPGGLLGKLYSFYFRYILPSVGTFISGVEGPYKYLPASVARFPAPAEIVEQMTAAGFKDVSWTPYTFGIAGLYSGVKA